MAVTSRRKKFSLKFELSPAGLLGVGVVCFCIFLWMFLLGVWAGQTVLVSGSFRMDSPDTGKTKNRPDVIPEKGKVELPAPAVRIKPAVETAAPPSNIVKPESSPPAQAALAGEDDSSYFAVQIGAYREARHAEETMKEWRAKGYEPFSRPPEGPDDQYTRVYVGRFAEVAEARKEAEVLARKENIKPFIATIPAGSGNNP